MKGISLIETLVALAVISIAFVSLVGVLVLSLQASVVREQTLEADALNREMLEAARSFRDNTEWDVDGLGTLALGTPYHPEETGGAWQIVGGTETIGRFDRQLVFEAVFRDGSDNIVESGGTVDPNSKRVVATVSWTDREESYQISYETLLTNF